MATHLAHLLARAFGNLPSSLGSNWLGLVFPFLVFLLTEVVTGFVRGWSNMMSHWKGNLLIGIAVAMFSWISLFLWCVVTTTYDDHMNLTHHIKELHQENQTFSASAKDEKKVLNDKIDSLKGKLTQMTQKC